ncbi:hypothetical protein [Vibrio parahaemolyticus]|uniref:hypothetical protein n=1 Tax=Vibrio parahaemolyticus TaxID=670 RepID=UPI000405E916|nr:hypothetical protein [Vibrio parahaemolyticus]TPA08246.1 hypothetical protein DXE05_24055 [Vibrio parahaemolyticus]HBI3715861.1 hypothetical protein [Vibrio parahaemolyticus]
MYNKFVAKDKDVFATPLFLLSIAIPMLTAIGIGIALYFSTTFSSVLSHIWATMKLPLAIASLSIPLATWVIANHRSAQITKSNKLQESKRLVETYLEQESFFERVYGRKITTAKWSFITKEDLPVIHAELYEFQKLQDKGEIKARANVKDDVQAYFHGTHRVFWEYYEHFVKEKENENNEFLLESFTTQLYEYLHYNLATFSRAFGTQNVDIEDTCLSTYISAYFEVYQLCVDLKIDTGDVNDESIRDDYETFIAVANLVSDNYGLRLENATLGRLKEDLGVKRMVKFATAEPHTQTINRLINEWAEKFVDNFEPLKMLAIEGKYLSFKLFTKDHNDFILMNFVETDEQVYFGEIQVSRADEKCYMPIYKTETGITVNQDATSAEIKMTDIISFIAQFCSPTE